MRFEQLTFLRFIAAFVLVVYHYGIHVYPFSHSAVEVFFQNGNVLVSFFFVLSGFVLVLGYWNQDEVSWLSFMKRRFARIYPIYLLALILMIGYYVAYSVFGNGEGVVISELIANTLMIQAWVPSYALTVNYVGWSLSVELFFYLLFPFVLKLFKRMSIRRMAIVVLMFWVLSQFVFWSLLKSDFYIDYPSVEHNFTFYFPVIHLNEFLVGMLSAVVFLQLKGKSRSMDLAVVLTGIGLIGLVVMNKLLSPLGGLYALPFGFFFVMVALNDGFISKLMSKKPFVILGGMSYSVYLLQVPVFEWLDVLFKRGDVQLNSTVFFFTAFIVLLLVSYLSYKYVELPIRGKILKLKR